MGTIEEARDMVSKVSDIRQELRKAKNMSRTSISFVVEDAIKREQMARKCIAAGGDAALRQEAIDEYRDFRRSVYEKAAADKDNSVLAIFENDEAMKWAHIDLLIAAGGIKYPEQKEYFSPSKFGNVPTLINMVSKNHTEQGTDKARLSEQLLSIAESEYINDQQLHKLNNAINHYTNRPPYMNAGEAFDSAFMDVFEKRETAYAVPTENKAKTSSILSQTAMPVVRITRTVRHANTGARR